MPDDELQEPFHPLDPADAPPDPPWPQLSLDEPLDTDLSDPELAPLALPPEFSPAPDLFAEDDQEWVRGLDAAAFSQAASLEDGPLEDTLLEPLAMTIWAEPIGERADPVPSSPLEDLSLGPLTTPPWSDEPGEPADPVLVTSASPARPFRLEAGRTGEGRWRPPHQRGTFQTIALVALAALAASGMYLSDRRGDHSALDFPSSEPGPVIAAQGVRPPTASLGRPNTGPPPSSGPSDVLVALGAGAAVTEPAESGAPGIGVAPRGGVLGPIPASRPAGSFAVGASPSSGPGSPTRPANPAVPAGPAASAAAQTPAPATSPPPFEAGAPTTAPPATQSVERATSPAAQRPPAPAADAPLDISPVDTYVEDLGPAPTSPPAPPAPTFPPATAPPATSPPPTSPPPPTAPATTSPPATSPPATSPPATSPPATSPPATSPPATSPPVTEPPATTPVTNGGGKTPPGQDNSGKGHPDGKPGGPG